MEKFIGLLVLLSFGMGVVCSTLLIIWFVRRRPLTDFNKIAVAFILLGAIIQIANLLVWFWINAHGTLPVMGVIQDIALWLWPSSIVLMALDEPAPGPSWGAILFIYSIGIFCNIGTYGAAGLVVGRLCIACKRWRVPKEGEIAR